MTPIVSLNTLQWRSVLPLALTLMALMVGCGGEPPEAPPPPGPQFGSLSGQIEDPFGGLLAGVSVKVSGATQTTTTTDSQGRFQLTSLPVGSYTLTFSVGGFDEASRTAQVRANQTTTLQVKMSPESLPSVVSRSARITSTGGARLEFEVDVVVIKADGTPLTGLGSSAFSIGDFNNLRFERQSVSSQVGTDAGPYSAVLLMDQSGSILTTDPVDSRIQAGKVFFSALSVPDNALLAAFASAGRLPQTPITVWGTFTPLGSSFYRPLDELAQLESGGTPLYESVGSMVELASSQGSNRNKAVVVFTDGENTDGGWTLEQAIAAARSRGVKLFTVGLSGSVNIKVLSQMAKETGGAMMWAEDARQMVSMYGSLGNLLRGTGQFYRTRWGVTSSAGTWGPGDWFYTGVEVQSSVGRLWAYFYIEVPGTGAGALPRISLSRPAGVTCPTGPAVGNRPVLCKAR